MSETPYRVNVVNNGSKPWKFLVYQQPPSITNGLCLAWLTSPYRIAVKDQISFNWNLKYSFVWANTGVVRPGVTFKATGVKDCDPNSKNLTNFTYENDTPQLSEPTVGGNPGSLTIKDGKAVPSQTFAVGIGMSGKGTFVVNAGPNLTHKFTPEPKYYVLATDEVTESEVMDIKTITSSGELDFPPNVYNLTATLKKDNTWDIAPHNFGASKTKSSL